MDRDRQAPPDPNRWSTNKMVEARTNPYFGTVVRTAKGSKRAKPGDGQAPAAKTVPAWDSIDMQMEKSKAAGLKGGHFTMNQLDSLKKYYRNKMQWYTGI